ncbi:hypothetical protein XENOCAPTIV_019627, partial [Xenoophorus captivus]
GRISVTSRWVGSQGLTSHSTDEDTYFASSFRSLTDDYMPCTTKRKGTIQCILTAPSSTKIGCWLTLMLLGSPPCSHSQKCVAVHAFVMETC